MPNVALCFSSGFLQEGTCQLGQVEQHESVNLMTHPLLGYLRSRLRMKLSRTDGAFDSITCGCSVYVFCQKNQPKLISVFLPVPQGNSLGVHVSVCSHVCVCFKYSPVIMSGRLAWVSPALSVFTSHRREHRSKAVNVLIQSRSGSSAQS